MDFSFAARAVKKLNIIQKFIFGCGVWSRFSSALHPGAQHHVSILNPEAEKVNESLHPVSVWTFARRSFIVPSIQISINPRRRLTGQSGGSGQTGLYWLIHIY